MRYFTTKLSENIEMTPEGYLLCRNVPVARTGTLEYLPEDVPEDITKGFTGSVVKVMRLDADVFSKETMASFEGKPVTIEHPASFVTPENWRDVACGHAQNIRRGLGEESDLLLSDLLITDPDAILLISPDDDCEEAREPLREVSCGYDAEYEAIGAGLGRQRDIIGNHIALVVKGRCGSRCAIKDAAAKTREKQEEPPMAGNKVMANNKKTTSSKASGSFWDRVFKNPNVKQAMDEAAKEATEEKPKSSSEASSEANQQTVTDSTEAITEKLDEVLLLLRSLLDKPATQDEDSAENTADEETRDDDVADNESHDNDAGDSKTQDDDAGDDDEDANESSKFKANDSAKGVRPNRGIFRDAASLAPELRFTRSDNANLIKRSSLRSAMRDAKIAKVITSCLAGRTIDSAPKHILDAAFTAAAEVVRIKNNQRTGDALANTSSKGTPKATSPADINKMNQEFRDSLNKRS